MPADLGQRDWMRRGPIEPTSDAVAEIDRVGAFFFHSEEPIADPDAFKISNGSGP